MKLTRIAGLKFEVVKKVVFKANISWQGPSIEIRDPLDGRLLVEIHPAGWVVIYPGYKFDGPSGPTKDDAINIGPSGLHDALYETLRGIGEVCFTRKQADAAMYQALLENLSKARAAETKPTDSKARTMWLATKYALLHGRYATWYRGLRWFAFYAARKRKLEDKYRTFEVL